MLPEGYIFGTVSFGGALMPAYGNDLSPSEIWDVVNYVRHGLVERRHRGRHSGGQTEMRMISPVHRFTESRPQE